MASEYQTPTIVVLGPVGELTLATGDGDRTDALFVRGTLRGDLTFS